MKNVYQRRNENLFNFDILTVYNSERKNSLKLNHSINILFFVLT